MPTDISFDQHKSLKNLAERGLPFDWVDELEWASALIQRDLRWDYGEPRYQVLGLIRGRLHAMVFTPRNDKVHVISLRKANLREIARYALNQKDTAA